MLAVKVILHLESLNEFLTYLSRFYKIFVKIGVRDLYLNLLNRKYAASTFAISVTQSILTRVS